MPPIIAAAVAIAGAALLARTLRREWDRVNRELDAAEAAPAEVRATLRRDPKTGVWRPDR